MGGYPLKTEFPPLLPEGFYPVSLAQLRARCVDYFASSATRRRILEGLEALILKLSAAGISGEVWVNGSFSTQKIDPEDADILVRVSSDIYDSDVAKRAMLNWATHQNRGSDHACDAYLWVEYQEGHPLFSSSEEDRRYWSAWFGKSRSGIPKGIFVIELPVAMP